jgi:hypothetical protein
MKVLQKTYRRFWPTILFGPAIVAWLIAAEALSSVVK